VYSPVTVSEHHQLAMTAGSRDDCKATQIKCYNGTSSNGLGKTRRAMKTGESYPGKAVLQYALHRY
jgi:hypothetical protein